MIPAEWASRARAPRDKILVQHKKFDAMRHGLWLPPNTVKYTRTAVGVVVDIHPSCPALDYKLGDEVMLTASGGTPIIFGYTAIEECELWVYGPRAVRFVFEEEIPEEAVEEEPESHLRRQQSLRAKIPEPDRRYIEGDPQGLR